MKCKNAKNSSELYKSVHFNLAKLIDSHTNLLICTMYLLLWYISF